MVFGIFEVMLYHLCVYLGGNRNVTKVMARNGHNAIGISLLGTVGTSTTAVKFAYCILAYRVPTGESAEKSKLVSGTVLSW